VCAFDRHGISILIFLKAPRTIRYVQVKYHVHAAPSSVLPRIRASFAWSSRTGLDLRALGGRAAWERAKPSSRSVRRKTTDPGRRLPWIPAAGIIAEYLDRCTATGADERRLLTGLDERAHRGAPADCVVQRQFLRGGLRPCWLTPSAIYKIRFMAAGEMARCGPAADVDPRGRSRSYVRYHLAYIGLVWAQTLNFLAGDLPR